MAIASKQELGKRKILFPREEVQSKKSKEDIIRAINKALQKARKTALIYINKPSYS